MFFENYFPFLIPILLIPILIYHKQIANAIGLLDFPNERKQHLNPIPKIGGIYIYLTTLITIFILYNFYNERFIFSFAFLTSGFFLIGLIDDKIEIKASSRLILQFFIIATTLRL